MRGVELKGIALRGACSVFAIVTALSCGTKTDDQSATGTAGSGGGNGASGNAASGGGTAGNAAGSGNPFLVPWTCPYTTSSGFMGSTPLAFTLNADGTLSSTSMIATTACTLRWMVSGTTAAAVSGQRCGSFEVISYTLKLDGDVAFFAAKLIQHGINIDADGTMTPIDIEGGFSGFCKNDDKPNAEVKPLCEVDPVISCGANRAGYLCLGVDSPEKMDSAISCPSVYTGGSACCTLGAGASSCQADATVTCAGGTSGYACSGVDTPAQANNVLCEPGKARGSETTYCCGTYTSPTCTQSTTVTGCPDYAFSCSGTARPRDTDDRLRCSPGNESLGSTLFCCSVRDPAIADTCAPDPTLECGDTLGYSCTGTKAPSAEDPSLTCAAPTPFEGKFLYCCLQ
jgi:hypothetical protein